MRVPPEAYAGKAKITLSFPASMEGQVSPTTFEVPIEEPDMSLDATLRASAAFRPAAILALVLLGGLFFWVRIRRRKHCVPC